MIFTPGHQGLFVLMLNGWFEIAWDTLSWRPWIFECFSCAAGQFLQTILQDLQFEVSLINGCGEVFTAEQDFVSESPSLMATFSRWTALHNFTGMTQKVHLHHFTALMSSNFCPCQAQGFQIGLLLKFLPPTLPIFITYGTKMPTIAQFLVFWLYTHQVFIYPKHYTRVLRLLGLVLKTYLAVNYSTLLNFKHQL